MNVTLVPDDLHETILSWRKKIAFHYVLLPGHLEKDGQEERTKKEGRKSSMRTKEEREREENGRKCENGEKMTIVESK